MARNCARLERQAAAAALRSLAPRLGCLGVRRRGIEVQEVWEEGQAHREIKAKLAQLSEQRETIETARKVPGLWW